MKFICIAKNYIAHAKEFGGDVPKEPVFFFKTENAVPAVPEKFPYPEFSKNVHYETELAVRIEKSCRKVSEADAASCWTQVTLGFDFTARDLQNRQKTAGYPWEICKAFEDSAPVGTWIDLKDLEKPVQNLNFLLMQNGSVVQKGNTERMIFSVNRLIAHISQYVTLDPGDILLTGTPEGVGPVVPGDILEAYLEDRMVLRVEVTG